VGVFDPKNAGNANCKSTPQHEESAAQLTGINPWINKPAESVEIDNFLRADLTQIALPKGIHIDFQLDQPTQRHNQGRDQECPNY
jgi:hypothetical protein